MGHFFTHEQQKSQLHGIFIHFLLHLFSLLNIYYIKEDDIKKFQAIAFLATFLTWTFLWVQ